MVREEEEEEEDDDDDDDDDYDVTMSTVVMYGLTCCNRMITHTCCLVASVWNHV